MVAAVELLTEPFLRAKFALPGAYIYTVFRKKTHSHVFCCTSVENA